MTPQESIEQAVNEPKKVQVGTTSVETQSIQDKIAAAEFTANQNVSPHKAVKLIRLRLPGAV